jgi:hypothetical protein
MFAALPVAFANPGAGGGGGGGGGVTVSISPVSQDFSGFASSWIFDACTATVTGGSASAFRWELRNIFGGDWSIFSGQGTDVATASADFIPASGTVFAELVCFATVSGVEYSGSATLVYNSLF